LDQAQGCRQRRDVVTIGDDNDLRRLRASFHDHLQVARDPEARAIGIARDSGIDECAAYDIGDSINEGMLHTAVWYVNNPMGTKLEQAELGGAHSASNGEPGPQPKSCRLSGYYGDCGQPVQARQRVERVVRSCGDARFAKSGTAGTGRPV
jgi:hypothetical protein